MRKIIIVVGSIFILITGLWLRFWHLEAVPAAFYHDEMDHVFTGQAISLWGTDITGSWSPWQFRPLKTLNYTSEWAPLFHGVIQTIFGQGVYQARLTNAIFGLLTVLLISMFSFLITRNKAVGLITFTVSLLNPWHVHISRLGYEATISLFFLIIAIVGLWGIMQMKQHLFYFGIWIIGAVGSYFTYHGSKFTIGAITSVFLVFIGKKIIVNKDWRKFAYILLIVSILSGFYLHTLIGNSKGLYGKRGTNDTFSLQMAREMADLERRDRIPFAFDRIMANKATTTLSELSKRYLFVFDPYRLWVEGVEGGYQFSLIISGYFGIVVLVGIVSHFVINRNRRGFLLLTILILVSPVASVVGSGHQALLRSALTYSLMLLAASWGIVSLYKHCEKQYNVQFFSNIFLLIMLLESLWFGMNYFSRYPLLAANNHYLDQRLVARYLKSLDTAATVVVERDPYSLARGYVFYNNLMSELPMNERGQFNNPINPSFKIGKITFTTDCPKTALGNNIWVIDGGKWKGCNVDDLLAKNKEKSRQRVGIPSPLDNGIYYTIWNDPICIGKMELQSYIKLTTLSDFSVENMSDQDFCSKWIRKE